MGVKFQIEYLFKATNFGQIVFAKHLNTEEKFWILEKSFLDQIEIARYLDIPRKLDEDGKLITDVFAFKLMKESDAKYFSIGQIVELTPGDKLTFLDPWIERKDPPEGLVNELKKEVCPNHPLFDKQLKAIATRKDVDEVLFEIINDESIKYAVVHLTWSRKQENLPFPGTYLFDHWTKVYENIVSDHKDYIAE